MTTIVQSSFGGIAPKLDPQVLADNLAQTANNCLFERGNLRALRNPLTTGTVLGTGVERVFQYQGAYLQYTDAVSIARSPIPNDVFERLYITTPGSYPQVRSGAATYRMGVPRPATPPAVSGPALPNENDADALLEQEDIYYVVTLVDVFGAEGPPSAPSAAVTRVRNNPLDVTPPSVPTGNYNLGTGAKWRFYRSNTGTSDTVFQFVTDRAISSGQFSDTVTNDQLQEVLPSATWTGPPDDDTSLWPDGPLQGIAQGPGGIMAGFVDRTVYFSEPYLPHAWPVEYAINVRHMIRGVVWISSGLLVVTDGDPVVISGTYPASMTAFTPEKGWPIAGGESLVDMGGWAIYNSPEGLVGVDGQSFTLLTEQLVDNNSWPVNSGYSSPKAGNSEGRYVLFWDLGVYGNGSYIFDPKAGVNALTTSDFWSDVAYHNDEENTLYVESSTGYLAKYDWGTTNMTYTWKSKVYSTPGATNFAYLEVIAQSYPVTVKLSAGDNAWSGLSQIANLSVTDRFTALPSGFENFHWEIEISDDKEVVMVGLYEDMTEVA